MNLFQRRALEKTATNEAVTRSDENAMTALAILEFERIANALELLVEFIEDGTEAPKELKLMPKECDIYNCRSEPLPDSIYCARHLAEEMS